MLAGRRVVRTPADSNMTITVVAFAFHLCVLYSHSCSFKRCRYLIYYWGDPDVDGRIILRWIFRKWEGVWGLDEVGSG
jgi:hypothetical protein